MNTKNLVALSLLIGIGAALHAVVPGIVQGMKPDIMLTMMFLGIIFFPDKKSVLLLGSVTGLISGITSTFPGGLIPNIIDKFITAFIILGLLLIFKKFSKSIFTICLITAIGTLVSGIIFLTSAYLLVGLPGPFVILFAGVVLPATALNTLTMLFIYPVATSVLKRTNLTTQLN